VTSPRSSASQQDSKAAPAPDLVGRDFTADEPGAVPVFSRTIVVGSAGSGDEGGRRVIVIEVTTLLP
jgi:hypothetical protein